jgi:hypothetical protein
MYEFMLGQGVPEGQAADYVKGMPTYWGDQPIVAAPAYIGIVVFFGNYSFFIDERKIKVRISFRSYYCFGTFLGKNFLH